MSSPACMIPAPDERVPTRSSTARRRRFLYGFSTPTAVSVGSPQPQDAQARAVRPSAIRAIARSAAATRACAERVRMVPPAQVTACDESAGAELGRRVRGLDVDGAELEERHDLEHGHD